MSERYPTESSYRTDLINDLQDPELAAEYIAAATEETDCPDVLRVARFHVAKAGGPTPYYQDDLVTLYHGNNLEVLPLLAEGSIAAVVTDPPYGLSFMGKQWDYEVPQQETWRWIAGRMKPGAHLLSFFGTRTYHRGVCQIEDAGLEIRDQIGWLYSSGFPKSLDVSKAIDKAAGVERAVLGYSENAWPNRVGLHTKLSGPQTIGGGITEPATDDAKKWAGWGTTLKPAWEPIAVARKPLVGTVAQNVLEYGTGALNIDMSRIAGEASTARTSGINQGVYGTDNRKGMIRGGSDLGRWPANVIHDGSEEVLAEFAMYGEKKSGSLLPIHLDHGKKSGIYGAYQGRKVTQNHGGDTGTAARFFYAAKASKKERGQGNTHPTVKPLALMAYLIGLVTPPGGVILDPFAGSGTTLLAASRMGVRCIGIEQSEEYCQMIVARLRAEQGDRAVNVTDGEAAVDRGPRTGDGWAGEPGNDI